MEQSSTGFTRITEKDKNRLAEPASVRKGRKRCF
jgi:hypothetical protein